MRMLRNTGGELERTSNGGSINEAIEVNPLSAISRPRRSAICLANPARENRLLQGSEMLADHKRAKTANDQGNLAAAKNG
jgi:hypothetical protein